MNEYEVRPFWNKVLNIPLKFKSKKRYYVGDYVVFFSRVKKVVEVSRNNITCAQLNLKTTKCNIEYFYGIISSEEYEFKIDLRFSLLGKKCTFKYCNDEIKFILNRNFCFQNPFPWFQFETHLEDVKDPYCLSVFSQQHLYPGIILSTIIGGYMIGMTESSY